MGLNSNPPVNPAQEAAADAQTLKRHGESSKYTWCKHGGRRKRTIIQERLPADFEEPETNPWRSTNWLDRLFGASSRWTDSYAGHWKRGRSNPLPWPYFTNQRAFAGLTLRLVGFEHPHAKQVYPIFQFTDSRQAPSPRSQFVPASGPSIGYRPCRSDCLLTIRAAKANWLRGSILARGRLCPTTMTISDGLNRVACCAARESSQSAMIRFEINTCSINSVLLSLAALTACSSANVLQ